MFIINILSRAISFVHYFLRNMKERRIFLIGDNDVIQLQVGWFVARYGIMQVM